MSILVYSDQGYNEVILDANCDYTKFYQAADILEKGLQIGFTSRINDFDTFYWDFKYNGSVLTLHYNVYLGLSIFPKELKQASRKDNDNVIEIGKMLFENLKNKG